MDASEMTREHLEGSQRYWMRRAKAESKKSKELAEYLRDADKRVIACYAEINRLKDKVNRMVGENISSVFADRFTDGGGGSQIYSPKVEKLLNLAIGTDSQDEAQNALDKARAMYRRDMAKAA